MFFELDSFHLTLLESGHYSFLLDITGHYTFILLDIIGHCKECHHLIEHYYMRNIFEFFYSNVQ